jgi:hypothetical protein
MTEPKRPKEYREGDERYSEFAADWLQVQRTYVLDEIARAVNDHNQIVVIGANGVGKSYGVGVLGVACTYSNPHTITHVTSGTSTTLKNNIWKPVSGLWENANENFGLPGKTYEGSREIDTELGDKWYFECIASAYPDDLEGPHNDHVFYWIEEADKPGITAEHIDSVTSTVTDENDRIIVIANPPKDKSNCVYDLIKSDEWHTLVFPSWDSHNIRKERGQDTGPEIGGLATTWKLQKDWKNYHDEPWPGLEKVIEWSDPSYGTDESLVEAMLAADPPNPNFRDDLDTRWYRRRAGIVPPANAASWVPFTVADVEHAYNRTADSTPDSPAELGIDVADATDETVAFGKRYMKLTKEYSTEGTNKDYPEQETDLHELARDWPDIEFVIDAVGEGSGISQYLARTHNVREFGAGENAVDEDEYRTKWAEGLYHFGKFLQSGGVIADENLYEQAKAAARVVKFSKKSLKRGDVIEATAKEEIKKELGYSPDELDAAIMCIWGVETDPEQQNRVSPTFTW